jgi:hypothetical protein
MERLVPLLCPGPSKNSDGRWEYQLRDRRTKQTLRVESDDRHFSVYELDQDWPGRTQPGPAGAVTEPSVDGLAVAAFDDATMVCFLDLKGKVSGPEQVAHAVRQLASSAQHFAPRARAGESATETHGDDHHALWSNQPGVGVSEKLAGHPDRSHQVCGVIILNREVARFQPPPLQLAGKKVRLLSVRVDRREAPNVGKLHVRSLWQKTCALHLDD